MSEGSIAGQDFQPRMRTTVNKSDRTTGKKAKKVARKSEVNQVPAKVEKKVVEARAAQSTGHRVPDCPRRMVFNGDQITTYRSDPVA